MTFSKVFTAGAGIVIAIGIRSTDVFKYLWS